MPEVAVFLSVAYGRHMLTILLAMTAYRVNLYRIYRSIDLIQNRRKHSQHDSPQSRVDVMYMPTST